MPHDLTESIAYVSAMKISAFLKVQLDRLSDGAKVVGLNSTVLVLSFGVAIISLGLAQATGRSAAMASLRDRLPEAVGLLSVRGPTPAVTLDWVGADLDGDGQADVANPTGQAPRVADAYGEGRFHASRDGGAREHEGVDYIATAGQTVAAPISGYVSKIGYAYADDQTLRYVEISNPALHIQARAFYVDPSVEVGDTVAIGHPVGRVHSLQRRYPGGIVDHVHLELEDRLGRKLDAAKLITARLTPVSAAAG